MFSIKSRLLQSDAMPRLFAIILAAMALALVSVPSAKAQWTGGVEGGTVVQDAGSATRLRLVLRNNTQPLSHYVYAEWLRSAFSENSYAVGYNPRYWLNKKYYVFGESEIGTDPVFGIDRELTLLTGLGGQFFTTKDQGLFVEVGVGGRSIQFENNDDANNEALGVARAGYALTLADTFKLDANVNGIRSDADVSQVTSEVGVAMRVSGGSIRIAYRSRYFRVGDAESITDDDTYISYGYSF